MIYFYSQRCKEKYKYAIHLVSDFYFIQLYYKNSSLFYKTRETFY